MLRYIKGTVGEGLGYSPSEDVDVYTDASYGSESETKGGRSGSVFMSGGVAVVWGSKLREVVVLGSTEVEYMAISYAMQEGLYLRMLQEEMDVHPKESGALLLLDN